MMGTTFDGGGGTIVNLRYTILAVLSFTRDFMLIAYPS